MVKIEEGKELKMKNVLSLRKQLTQLEIQQELKEIGQVLKEVDVKLDGNLVTTTFDVQTVDGDQVFDTEILVPIDRKVTLPEKYNFKKEFILANAIYVSYQGNPSNMTNTLNEMLDYINKNGYQQITSAYNVQKNSSKTQNDINNMIIDIYIGVSNNRL